MRLRGMRTRSWMAVVIYTALDCAALHAALTRGLMLGLGFFVVLTLVVPIMVFLSWVIRPNTLY
jgi:hypothetical protein